MQTRLESSWANFSVESVFEARTSTKQRKSLGFFMFPTIASNSSFVE
jgi:hypothetical protein